jgi:malate dehydrogenase (oxaloacetate-decarboxylating)
MTQDVRRVSRTGHALIRDPLFNKGAAFTAEERRDFDLEGLLPHRTVSIEVQRQRVLENLDRLVDPLEKYVALASLQDRNEQLFFNVLTSRIEDLLPIVYTPTVGLATQRFSHVFQRGRGAWITPAHRGSVARVLTQAAAGREIRLIVATDNESILGIGDQGAGGILISIGKLSLYTAAAGIDPAQVLPISIDVGTDNQALLDDPLYLGWPERRLRGAAYEALIDEFVEAVRTVFPRALVQWEDFRKDNALRVLDRYRERLPSFNDDIQGTGAVALAGILTSERVTGRVLAAERVVILGGGAAGLGIARQIRAGMAAAGIDAAGCLRRVAVMDSKGLILGEVGTDDYKRELAWSTALAAEIGVRADQRGLLDVVRAFRPTVLIGTSGQAGAFSREVIEACVAATERPVVMPLSNPTANCEGQPSDLYAWSHGKALVATGSPFPDTAHLGQSFRIGQGNNAFVFPGVGLAAVAGDLTRIDDSMFLAAAVALAQSVTDAELAAGLLYPPVARLSDVSRAVATAVLEDAERRGVWRPMAGRRIADALDVVTWRPVYQRYVRS